MVDLDSRLKDDTDVSVVVQPDAMPSLKVYYCYGDTLVSKSDHTEMRKASFHGLIMHEIHFCFANWSRSLTSVTLQQYYSGLYL